MKGIVALVLAVVFACSIATATPYTVPPKQYEEFCEHQLVSGNGVMYTDISIVDKHIALNYRQTMDNLDQLPADIEMDSTHIYSQHEFDVALPCDTDQDQVCTGTEEYIDPVTGLRKQKVPDKTALNFYEDTKMAFDGEDTGSTLNGEKFLESKGFYGGIDASVREFYSVQQLEKDQKAYFASTNNSMCEKKDRCHAAGDKHKPLVNNIAHSIGLDTKNSFNGTWGTSAKMHKIFYKDISADEMFTGVFEVAKEIKFHENAIGCAPVGNPCCIIDC